MKIAVFSDSYLGHVDGVMVSTIQLCKGLLRKDVEVLMVAPKSPNERNAIISKNFRLMRLPSVPGVVYPDVRAGILTPMVMSRLRNEKCDLFLITTPGSVGMGGLFLSKMMKVPSVGVFHGYFMEPEYIDILGIRRGKQRLSKVLWDYARLCFDNCDRIITPSFYTRDDILEHNFRKKTEVCYNGCELDKVRGRKDELEKLKKKWKVGEKGLIYVGRLSPEKNLLELIDVFGKVITQVKEAQLVIVGTGPMRKKLVEVVREKKLEHRVMFLGEFGNEELIRKQVFRLGKVFVSCSRSEVQPMSFIEAMHFGLPLVVTRARGSKEMINGNGYLVKPGDVAGFSKKVIELLSNGGLRKKLSEKSKKAHKKHTVEAMVKCYMKVFEDLLVEKSKSKR